MSSYVTYEKDYKLFWARLSNNNWPLIDSHGIILADLFTPKNFIFKQNFGLFYVFISLYK